VVAADLLAASFSDGSISKDKTRKIQGAVVRLREVAGLKVLRDRDLVAGESLFGIGGKKLSWKDSWCSEYTWQAAAVE
jgi:hypothetical protein